MMLPTVALASAACSESLSGEASVFCREHLNPSDILELAMGEPEDAKLNDLVLEASLARLDDSVDADEATQDLLEYVDRENWYREGCTAQYERSLTAYPEVHGSITVEGRFCDDLGGFGDIPRMQPVLRTVDGDFLTELDASLFNGIVSELDRNLATLGGEPACRSSFDAEDVPRLDKYLLDAGRRGEFILDSEDFRTDIYSGGENEPEIFSLTIGG